MSPTLLLLIFVKKYRTSNFQLYANWTYPIILKSTMTTVLKNNWREHRFVNYHWSHKMFEKCRCREVKHRFWQIFSKCTEMYIWPRYLFSGLRFQISRGMRNPNRLSTQSCDSHRHGGRPINKYDNKASTHLHEFISYFL